MIETVVLFGIEVHRIEQYTSNSVQYKKIADIDYYQEEKEFH